MKFRIFTLIHILLISLFFNKASFSQNNNQKFLIVLDVQQYWTEKALSENESKTMIKTINHIIELTNPEKVIYIKTLTAEKILSISLKGIKVDTVFAFAFDPNLALVNNTIFEKTEGDAFKTKELLDYLAEKNAKEIIITGLLAEKCVLKTISGGISMGYEIFTIPDAIGSKSNKCKQKVLKEIRDKGCHIIEINDL